jgi:PGF-CTERM protein
VAGTGSDSDEVGGLVGENSGATVSEATASGDVTASGDGIGGLVGENTAGNVSKGTATGAVDGDRGVGGLVGVNTESSDGGTSGNIVESEATGDINGSRYVGGLVGSNGVPPGWFGSHRGGLIESSNASGTVTATGGTPGVVGGLVGFNDDTATSTTSEPGQLGTVRESYATGDVSSPGSEVGGLVGTNLNDTVVDSYATGDVDGGGQTGGLVGNNTGTDAEINRSYAAGGVSGSGDVGGLVGRNGSNAAVRNSYWDTKAAGQTGSAGAATGLTTDEMKGESAESTMAGFDFETTWSIVTNSRSYPFLADNPQDTAPGFESTSDDDPEITDYDVETDGGAIVVTVGSTENLAELEVEVDGQEEATLDREEFSGDRFEGFEASYRPGDPGEYTVELTSARTANNEDVIGGETFSLSVTIEGDTETVADETPTPTDDGTTLTDDGTTPTDDDTALASTATDNGDGATATQSGGTTATPARTDEPGGPTVTSTAEDQPGFGALVALVALLASVLVLARRRSGAG